MHALPFPIEAVVAFTVCCIIHVNVNLHKGPCGLNLISLSSAWIVTILRTSDNATHHLLLKWISELKFI